MSVNNNGGGDKIKSGGNPIIHVCLDGYAYMHYKCNFRMYLLLYKKACFSMLIN